MTQLQVSPKNILGSFRICIGYYVKVLFAVLGLLESTDTSKVPQLPSKGKVLKIMFGKFMKAVALSYNFFVMT